MLTALENAKIIANIMHEGQTDKAGNPYFEHVEAVAQLLKIYGEEAQIAGYLHDIVEDTSMSIEHLRFLGFSNNVIDAVIAVTRQPNEKYMDFIHRASQDPLGRLVKLADNEHNLSRLSLLSADEAESLRKRYMKAKEVLLAVV